MHPHRIISFAFRTILMVHCGCASLVNPTYTEADLNEARMPDQVHVEDSSSVFFLQLTNPFPDRELMWFAVLEGDSVEMHVFSMADDSLDLVLRFQPQESSLYTIACEQDPATPVKCVLVINGRRKCARVYPSWRPQMQQWTTQYAIEYARGKE